MAMSFIRLIGAGLAASTLLWFILSIHADLQWASISELLSWKFFGIILIYSILCYLLSVTGWMLLVTGIISPSISIIEAYLICSIS